MISARIARHDRRYASSEARIIATGARYVLLSPSLPLPLFLSLLGIPSFLLESFPFVSFRSPFPTVLLPSTASSSPRLPPLRPSDRADHHRPPPTRVEEHLNRERRREREEGRREAEEEEETVATSSRDELRSQRRSAYTDLATTLQRATLSAPTNSESRKARRTHVFARSYTRRA